jgi:urease gamma subunit
MQYIALQNCDYMIDKRGKIMYHNTHRWHECNFGRKENMKTDLEKLKDKIAETGRTQEQIAELMKMDRNIFAKKMKFDGLPFTISEVYKLIDIIQLSNSEVIQIFLSD